MLNTYDSIERFITAQGSTLEDWAADYGEPGYSLDGKRGILLVNWKQLSKRALAILENYYCLEWSDEWVVAYNNNSKAYRTTGDCYAWKPYYHMTVDNDIIGGDEIENGTCAEEYIQHLIDNPCEVNLFDLDLPALGFVLCRANYVSGWHPGQDANRHEILVAAQEQWPDHEFIFNDLQNSQFCSLYSLWRRKVAQD